jgi:hypothetical protein
MRIDRGATGLRSNQRYERAPPRPRRLDPQSTAERTTGRSFAGRHTLQLGLLRDTEVAAESGNHDSSHARHGPAANRRPVIGDGVRQRDIAVVFWRKDEQREQ